MILNLTKINGDIPNLYRGGQPKTPEDWDSLWALGITQVIKLNTEYEGRDVVPSSVELMKCEIDPAHQILGGLDRQAILDTVGFIKENTLIHCSHGMDRTGLLVALHRLINCGWKKNEAEAEMLEHGFHVELLGLWGFWKHFNPDTLTLPTEAA